MSVMTWRGGTDRRSAGQLLLLAGCLLALASCRSAGSKDSLGWIALSPGGATAADDIVVVRPDGSGRRVVVAAPGAQFDPSWSPDGKRIVYRDSARGINEDDEIYVVNADGTGRTNLTRNPANDYSPAWSPDGTLIAFSSNRGGMRSIWVMRPDGSDARSLRISGEYPSWSPDSRSIVFARPGGDYDLWIVAADGTSSRPLVEGTTEDFVPAWSPKGSLIAFARGFEGARDIWVVKADGSGLRQLTSGPEDDFAPAWSPDGEELAFARNQRLFLMRPDGADVRDAETGANLPDWTR